MSDAVVLNCSCTIRHAKWRRLSRHYKQTCTLYIRRMESVCPMHTQSMATLLLRAVLPGWDSGANSRYRFLAAVFCLTLLTVLLTLSPRKAEKTALPTITNSSKAEILAYRSLIYSCKAEISASKFIFKNC